MQVKYVIVHRDGIKFVVAAKGQIKWASKYANAHCIGGEITGMSEVEVVE